MHRSTRRCAPSPLLVALVALLVPLVVLLPQPARAASTPSATYDLIVTDIAWSPADPAPGTATTFRATVRNVGAAATPTQLLGVRFTVDGTTAAWSGNTTTSLAAGASATLTASGGPSGATWRATRGGHVLQAWVDDVNRLPDEEDEDDNTLVEDLVIGEDLVVTGLTWSPASPAPGAAVSFSATIRNAGSVATPGGVIHAVTFFVDGTRVGWSGTSTTSLAPGATRTLTATQGPGGTATWRAVSGAHVVRAWVDDVDRIDEAVEDDNTFDRGLPVGAALRGSTMGFAGAATLSSLTVSQRARQLDVIAASGARYLRFGVGWGNTEPARGSFDWSRSDRMIADVRAHGLEPLVVLGSTPAWARPPGTTSRTAPAIIDGHDHMADFAAYAGKAAARWAGEVRAFEVWNEPNLKQFWMPAPDKSRYATMLKLTYRAIKAASPDAVVLTGGTSPGGSWQEGSSSYNPNNPVVWYRDLYAKYGIKGSFDAIAHHPYQYSGSPLSGSSYTNGYLLTAAIHDVMVQNGDGAKRIWATELGSPTCTADTACISEAQQAQTLREYASRWFGAWAPWAGPFIVYRFDDLGTDQTDKEDFFGLWRLDLTRKPAADVFLDLADDLR